MKPDHHPDAHHGMAAVWVEPALKVNDCRDQKDNKYPELAATAGAEVIISSDGDRLVLDPGTGYGSCVRSSSSAWRSLQGARPRKVAPA